MFGIHQRTARSARAYNGTTPLLMLCTAVLFGPQFSCKKRDPQVLARDGGPAILVPQVLAPVNGGSPSGREIDAPLAWMYLPQAPVTTGSVPDVLVASQLPCGFQAMYGTVTQDDIAHTLRVRMRARYTGQGLPPDRVTPCPTEPPSIQFVSLNRVRLGEFTVIDAAAHPTGSHPVPRPVQLSVVRDDNTAPAESVRWVRQCVVGHDRECVGGGVCGEVPATPGRGVCVPPTDAFLAVNRPCPTGTAQITLNHPGEYEMPVHGTGAQFEACLPACNANGQCPPTLRCESNIHPSADSDAGAPTGACVPL